MIKDYTFIKTINKDIGMVVSSLNNKKIVITPDNLIYEMKNNTLKISDVFPKYIENNEIEEYISCDKFLEEIFDFVPKTKTKKDNYNILNKIENIYKKQYC